MNEFHSGKAKLNYKYGSRQYHWKTWGPLVLYCSPECWGYVKISGYWGNFQKKFMDRGRHPIRAKLLMSTGVPHHYSHLLQVWKESLQPLTLFTSFHDLITVYSRRSGADSLRGQHFGVNRNHLSLGSFATSFKKISLKSDFIPIFFMILYMYIAQGKGTKFWCQQEHLVTSLICCKFQKHLFEVWIYTNFLWFYTCI